MKYGGDPPYLTGDKAYYNGALYGNSTVGNFRAKVDNLYHSPHDYPAGWEATTCSGSSDTTAPSAPSSLTKSGITSSAVTLSWTASTDSEGAARVFISVGHPHHAANKRVKETRCLVCC